MTVPKCQLVRAILNLVFLQCWPEYYCHMERLQGSIVITNRVAVEPSWWGGRQGGRLMTVPKCQLVRVFKPSAFAVLASDRDYQKIFKSQVLLYC